MDFQSSLLPIINVNVLFLIIGSFIFLIITKLWKKRNIPPGPTGLSSLIGIVQLFKPFAFRYVYKLTKQYGPIVEVSVFGQPMVIFGNYEILKEAFVKNGENFIDRPMSCALEEYSHSKGLVISNGEFWKEQKKFAFCNLIRSVTQESYDKIILQEIELAFNHIQEKNGQSFNPKMLIVQMMKNIVMIMSTSERWDYDNLEDVFQKNMDEIAYNFRMNNPVNFFSPLKYILKSHKRYKESISYMEDYFMNIVEKHQNSFDENNLRDYIDVFLLKMYEEEKKENTNTTFTKEQLIGSLKDFIMGGSETSAATLIYGIFYLLHHPNIQTKVYKEITDVIGISRTPIMSDCSKLHFTQATILEIQRLSRVAPLSIARIAKENIKIKGYDILKGSFIIPNLYAIHIDPKYWKDPLMFDPNRFLDINGQIKKDIKSFLPFCTGYRQCLGESLAKSELFLIFASLIQRYSFKTKASELPNMYECLDGAALFPLPYEVSFILK